MSDEPEQAMKRANATDSAEGMLAALHARDYQVRLAKRHPARWRLLTSWLPTEAIRVTPRSRKVTIEAMARMQPPLLRKSPILRDRWHVTGWGHMVRDAGTRCEAGVYTRTEAGS